MDETSPFLLKMNLKDNENIPFGTQNVTMCIKMQLTLQLTM